MKKYDFHSEARKEYLDAIHFYLTRSKNISFKFTGEFKRTLNFIRKYPEVGVILSDNVRQFLLMRFPYSILYLYHKELIFITAVMHQSRDPEYWKDRI